MSKNNNMKGFTLIELLAVIVILAVVLVVTIPTVLSSMGNAKTQTLTNTVNSITEWFEKEYQAYLIDTADAEFTNYWTPTGQGATKKTTGTAYALDTTVAAAAGINKVSNFDIANSKIMIKSSGRVCIKLVASDSGDFSSVETKTVWSSSCTATDQTTMNS